MPGFVVHICDIPLVYYPNPYCSPSPSPFSRFSNFLNLETCARTDTYHVRALPFSLQATQSPHLGKSRH